MTDESKPTNCECGDPPVWEFSEPFLVDPGEKTCRLHCAKCRISTGEFGSMQEAGAAWNSIIQEITKRKTGGSK